jgi:hypothetical protein
MNATTNMVTATDLVTLAPLADAGLRLPGAVHPALRLRHTGRDRKVMGRAPARLRASRRAFCPVRWVLYLNTVDLGPLD